ncbi:MAG: hypothetical protein ACKPKO_05825, partial [Candidatus Fonsibacter sp.]
PKREHIACILSSVLIHIVKTLLLDNLGLNHVQLEASHVTTWVTCLWRPIVHSEVVALSFDVGSSEDYH